MSMGEPPEVSQLKMAMKDVPGIVSIGWDGQAITVTVKDESVRASIPPKVGNVPTRVIVSGPLRSF